MVVYRAIKCRAYPNKEQQKQINVTIGCCRFIYNHMLERNIKVHKRRGEHLTCFDMNYLLTGMKEYFPWLREADAAALCYSCKQLDNAYKRFFSRVSGYPKFHSKYCKQSYTTTKKKSIYIIDEHHIRIPKLGAVYVRGLRELPKDAKTGYATISRDKEGKYYISLEYTYEVSNPKHGIQTSIGLDFKVNCLYVSSEGTSPKMHNWINESQDKLKRAQQILSRKVGYKEGEQKSNNYIKQLHKVEKIQRKIANRRKDFLHKESRRLAKQYSTICIEDIRIKEMLIDDNVIAKQHKINRAIYNAGWNLFTNMLEYKAVICGGTVVKVNKNFKSSEICSVCGYIETKVKNVKIRKWKCPQCKTKHDRDINAAINILAEGLRLSTVGTTES